MNDEKMMILSMLQDGKISSEEAIKLLEALEETEKDNLVNVEKTKEKIGEIGEIAKEQGKKIGDIGVDLGNKIAKAFRDMKFNTDSNGLTGKSINTKVEMDISHMEAPSIDIEAVNGRIILENWDENFLSIEVNCRYREGLFQENEDFFSFYEMDNKIIFSPEFSSNISIDLKVYLPDKYYEEISLKSSNGQIKIDNFIGDSFDISTSNAAITIESIKAKKIHLNTKNGRIILDDVLAPKIEATTGNSNILIEDVETDNINLITKNGRIYISNIMAKEIIANTSNGAIELEFVNSEQIELKTSNAKVQLNDLDLDKLNYLKIITSNGIIDVDLNKLNKEIYLDLVTSIGSIDLDLPSLVYKLNKQVNLGKKNIIAHSINYKEGENSLKLLATTSNASIKIY